MPATIALIAHDSKKEALIELVRQHRIVFGRYHLIATATTGQRIEAQVGLQIERYKPGSLGGDLQIAADIVAGKVSSVFFLIDPREAQRHEPDLQTVLRACEIHDVPIATNLATSQFLIEGLARTQVAHLIFNPASGQGDADDELELIQSLLEPYFNLQVHLTTLEEGAASLTRRALEARADLVIASGGDGTVSAVAGELINSNTPLGIIPRGTANAFGSAIGISTTVRSIRTACRIIAEGQTRQVDAAWCNRNPMILLAGIGFEAETVEKASREFKDRWGALAYLMAGWQQLNEQELFSAQIELDGETLDLEAGAVTIANAAPLTSVLAQGSGEVVFDDGLLDVTIVTAESKFQALTAIINTVGAALIRVPATQPNVNHLRTRSIMITTDPPQKVVVDGEIVGRTPLEIHCIPRGLTVLVPVN